MPASRFSLAGRKVFVAGHRGMVGSAIVRRLASEDCEVLTASRAELDLMGQSAVRSWFADRRPDVVVLAAAKVGGILANDSYPADFLYDNLMIEANVIEASYRSGVEKLLFLGSSCIYPKFAEQPIREESLLTGSLEQTNEWYAIAKIAGIKLCQAYHRQFGCNFISAMPTNLYGQGDNFDPQTSHVLPALIRKAHEAKQAQLAAIEVWGTGSPRREFLHVDDLADACIVLLKKYSEPEHINVGFGEEITILELTKMVCKIVEYAGDITFNTDRPDGTPRKLMATDKIRAMGWSPSISLPAGISQTYQWFLDHLAS